MSSGILPPGAVCCPVWWFWHYGQSQNSRSCDAHWAKCNCLSLQQLLLKVINSQPWCLTLIATNCVTHYCLTRWHLLICLIQKYHQVTILSNLWPNTCKLKFTLALVTKYSNRVTKPQSHRCQNDYIMFCIWWWGIKITHQSFMEHYMLDYFLAGHSKFLETQK